MNWEECTRLAYAKKTAKDDALIKSMQESALAREKTAGMLRIDETTKETLFTLYYDVLRELVSIEALKNGYKIYNHECLSAFLAEVLKDNDSAREFDNLRRLRNNISYEGKRLGHAKEAIDRARGLIKRYH
ncbi:hypothetical protein JW826_03580 [Candidatus Woesearchaeota archaeon]|nr:hypothetical protein [Candidatus Woesearchaeota archaeon]